MLEFKTHANNYLKSFCKYETFKIIIKTDSDDNINNNNNNQTLINFRIEN